MRVQEVPNLGKSVGFGRGPEACQVVGVKELDERVVVVLVDGLEGARSIRCAVSFRGVGRGSRSLSLSRGRRRGSALAVSESEGSVCVTPFLGKIWPGDCRGEEADGGGNGCGGRVEREGGLGGECLGDCSSPVDNRAEDL